MAFLKRRLSSSSHSHPLLNPEHIARQLEQLQNVRSVWVALSGGRDSTVLLDLCADLRAQLPLSFKAVHIHHGLQSIADQWVEHCQNLCRGYDIPLAIHSVNAAASRGQSPEEAARDARYRVFNSLIGKGDLLMMAHHQDDQAETVLLQMLRGAGLEGISGMPEMSAIGGGLLLRPLLQFDAGQLLDYAKFKKLEWIEDPSNQDSRFDRNYLRHRIMPLVKRRWPSASRAISRSSRHAAKGAEHQRQQQVALAKSVAPSGHFDLRLANQLDPQSLRLAIRGWFQDLRLRMPTEQWIEIFIREFLKSGPDRNPVLRLSDGSQLQRYREVAYRIPLREMPAPCPWPNWRETLELPGANGTIAMTEPEGLRLSSSPWDLSTIQIRYRMGGEKIRLSGRDGHHCLKGLFQESGIPTWVRSHIPLLYLDDRLACVGGFWLNDDIFNPAIWANAGRPKWLPPKDLDPSGALEALQGQRKDVAWQR